MIHETRSSKLANENAKCRVEFEGSCSSILFRFAQPNRKHFYYKYRRQEIQQMVEGAASNKARGKALIKRLNTGIKSN